VWGGRTVEEPSWRGQAGKAGGAATSGGGACRAGWDGARCRGVVAETAGVVATAELRAGAGAGEGRGCGEHRAIQVGRFSSCAMYMYVGQTADDTLRRFASSGGDNGTRLPGGRLGGQVLGLDLFG